MSHSANTVQPRLLLVEDNPVNQFVAKEMLQQLGCDVKIAENGQEACDLVMQRPFDLVFMDCQMPLVDGYNATEQIRSWEQENNKAPVIIVALTAHALSSDRERCLGAGMNDYLTKPFTITNLEQVLRINLPGIKFSAPPDETASA